MEEQTEFYVVYPGSDKLDLADKKKPVAICIYHDHAEEIKKRYWKFGSIEKVSKEGLLKIIQKEL